MIVYIVCKCSPSTVKITRVVGKISWNSMPPGFVSVRKETLFKVTMVLLKIECYSVPSFLDASISSRKKKKDNDCLHLMLLLLSEKK